MQPVATAWLVFTIPLVVVHAAWLWSSLVGAIDWCIPYWSGCTSISKAARSSDALFLFRSAMTLNAGLLILFWLHVAAFLRLNRLAGHSCYWIIGLGVTGALFLVVYANFLGYSGEVYRFMRHYGVTVYFGFTVLAQMLLLRQWRQLPAHTGKRQVKAIHGLCWWMLLLGLASSGCNLLLPDPLKDMWENIIEWHFALSMNIYFALVALLWQSLGYRQQPLQEST